VEAAIVEDLVPALDDELEPSPDARGRLLADESDALGDDPA